MEPPLVSLHHFSKMSILLASLDVLISTNVSPTATAIKMLTVSMLLVDSNVFARQKNHLEMVSQARFTQKLICYREFIIQYKLYSIKNHFFIQTSKGCFADPNDVPTTESPPDATTTLAPPAGAGTVTNDFNCAGQGFLSQVANVANDVAISCFGTSCGVQCVDPSKSPSVSGLFCQNTGKAKKQGWKNGNKVI